mmetsp:Transcript_15245/g.25466  ORF Transcript_15245/g.25466 Transcript_15245/m.25466 type:complete len:80 (+) Transcript_15245:64-303(+)
MARLPRYTCHQELDHFEFDIYQARIADRHSSLIWDHTLLITCHWLSVSQRSPIITQHSYGVNILERNPSTSYQLVKLSG